MSITKSWSQSLLLPYQVEDLETWINEKEIIAGLQDIGQDFDHVQVNYATTVFIYTYYAAHLKINGLPQLGWDSEPFALKSAI